MNIFSTFAPRFITKKKRNHSMNIKAEEIISTLLSMGDEWQRENLMRFFKTGKGEYGESDKFIGIKVPDTRTVVKEARLRVPLEEIGILLESEWHEVRLCGFLLLVEEMKAALPKAREVPTLNAGRREEIARFYLKHARMANNWDLVDMSCPKILGKWLGFAPVASVDRRDGGQ